MRVPFKVHLSLLYDLQEHLVEITGMDEVTFQPAAGAHGEWTGLMMIRAFHEANGDLAADKGYCSRLRTWNKPCFSSSCWF